MGFKDRKIIKREGFEPLALNEGNVTAIFNRCKPSGECKDLTAAMFISKHAGFKESDEGLFLFDRQAILSNKKNIEYLYGQLFSIHTQAKRIRIGEFPLMYLGNTWTTDTDMLMKFLYLGASDEFSIFDLFEAKDMTTCFTKPIKPTLSPKDPNFPTWWEAHKAEWEDPAE